MTDYADYGTPGANAQQIAATGVPLLHLARALISNTSTAVAGGATVTLVNTNITQPSYEIILSSQTTAGATIPFYRVKIRWVDAATQATVAVDSFILPAAIPGTVFGVRGHGSSKGSIANVTVTNLDPSVSQTVTATMLQSSRVYSRDVWTWNAGSVGANVVPGFTLPSLPDDISCLGLLDNLTVNASSTLTFLFGMWDGLIQMAGSVITGTASNLSIPVRPQPDSAYAATAVSSSGSGNTINRQFAGARAPLRVDLINSATTAMVVSLGLWAIR